MSRIVQAKGHGAIDLSPSLVKTNESNIKCQVAHDPSGLSQAAGAKGVRSWQDLHPSDAQGLMTQKLAEFRQRSLYLHMTIGPSAHLF
jgi:hypothetical protein